MSSLSHIESVLADFLFGKLHPKPQDITVALSGGVDSVVLLHACCKLKQTNSQINIDAIHIHHGISANADDWLDFCTNLCNDLSVSLQTAHVNVQKQPRKSLESLARDARYQAINQLAKPGTTVLLAQHEDDQAETVLLQLKRGAGPKGLSGMAESFTLMRDGLILNTLETTQNSLNSVQYARPWINNGVSKSDILDYAQAAGLEWVEDESNQDISYDRNFLRQKLMPLLTEKWPQITHTIARSAQHCASQTELVEAMATEALSNVLSEEGGLQCRALLVLPIAMQREVLRLWLSRFVSQSPSAMQVTELLKLAHANKDKNGKVLLKTHQCRRDRMILLMIANHEIIEQALPTLHLSVVDLKKEDKQVGDLRFSIQKNTLMIARLSFARTGSDSQTWHLELPVTSTKVTVSYGNLSRRFKPNAQRPSKTLKAWMKEAKVPEWQRLGVPIVEVDGDIVGILL